MAREKIYDELYERLDAREGEKTFQGVQGVGVSCEGYTTG